MNISMRVATQDKKKILTQLKRLVELIEQDGIHAMSVIDTYPGDLANVCYAPLDCKRLPVFTPVKQNFQLLFSKDQKWVESLAVEKIKQPR